MVEQTVRHRWIDRVVTGLVICLIAGCVLVIWKRDMVRGWWWAGRLAAAADVNEQARYAALMASVQDAAIPATWRLLDDPRENVRCLAVGIVAATKTAAGLAPLAHAMQDASPDVRDAAARVIAVHASGEQLDLLRSLAQSDRVEVAMAACVALGLTDTVETRDVLRRLAVENRDASVRAQAVESMPPALIVQDAALRARLLGDAGSVSEELYTERAAREAAAYAGASVGMPAASTSPGRQTVDDVVRRVLARAATSSPAATQP